MTDTPNEPTFQALAPIGTQANLKSFLERHKTNLAAVLPRHVTPERILKTMLVAANRNPEILECTQASVIETITRASELGLDLSGTLGEAYPVPFNNEVKWRDAKGVKRAEKKKQLALIPGYRGLAKLARQSGEVGRIEAEPVYENDKFVYRKGTSFELLFEPKLDGNRGAVRGYYALIMNRDDSSVIASDYMTMEQVEVVRKRANSGESPAWRDHFDEMGRKTVFRRCSKWAPLSPENATAFFQALALDNEDYDFDAMDTIDVEGSVLTPEDILGKPESPQEPTKEPEATEAPAEPEQQTLEAAQQRLEEKRKKAGIPTEKPAMMTKKDGDEILAAGRKASINPASLWKLIHEDHDNADGWEDLPAEYKPEILKKLAEMEEAS